MVLKAVLVAVIAVVGLFVFRNLIMLGYYQHYFKQHPGTCRRVKGVEYGSENFQTLTDGLTFVTSGFSYPPLGPGYKSYLKQNNVQGRMFLVDLKKPETEAKELKIKPSKDFKLSSFRPHGISVLEDSAKGHHLVYVVNHCDETNVDRVEKFRYLPANGELEHLKTFTSDLLHVTNDMALTGEDTFYISDYLYYKTHVMHVLEQFAGMKLGSLLYFNGSGFTPMVTGLEGPNGMVLSDDKKFLYVALPHTKSIHTYSVKADHGLQLEQDLHVHTSVDNLHLSQDSQTLYGGAHPIGMKVLHYVLDPNNVSPSQVISLPLKDRKVQQDQIAQIFYDHGDLISASTVASVYNKKLLVGSIINKLAVCDLP